MFKRLVLSGIGALVIGVGGFWVLTQPRPIPPSALPVHAPDLANGARMFWVGGCASCHAAPGAKGDAKLRLAGGLELKTPFGVFRAPNISPDATAGIGKWTTIAFVNAMVRGVSPDGRHYYPAFPYTYYQRMRLEDLIDLKGFLDGLPADANVVRDHSLRFPFNIRRGLGLWKLRYLGSQPLQTDAAMSDLLETGRYLVEGPGHCGACHTPRDGFGGAVNDKFLAGAGSLESKAANAPQKHGAGTVPNITPHDDGIGRWSEKDIEFALETGLDPEFDSFGGSMVAVQENLAKLSARDRKSIAAYLKSIPGISSPDKVNTPAEPAAVVTQ